MTEQEKREKVIKGLECRLDVNGCKYKNCLNCDYRHDIDHLQWACQVDGIIEDALELLKAQEPRVMTLEDLMRSQEDEVPVWFESRGTWHGRKGFWIFVYDINIEKNVMQYNAAHMCSNGYLGMREYNRVWRCLTSRPSDTQRSETPWNT